MDFFLLNDEKMQVKLFLAKDQVGQSAKTLCGLSEIVNHPSPRPGVMHRQQFNGYTVISFFARDQSPIFMICLLLNIKEKYWVSFDIFFVVADPPARNVLEEPMAVDRQHRERKIFITISPCPRMIENENRKRNGNHDVKAEPIPSRRYIYIWEQQQN